MYFSSPCKLVSRFVVFFISFRTYDPETLQRCRHFRGHESAKTITRRPWLARITYLIWDSFSCSVFCNPESCHDGSARAAGPSSYATIPPSTENTGRFVEIRLALKIILCSNRCDHNDQAVTMRLFKIYL